MMRLKIRRRMKTRRRKRTVSRNSLPLKCNQPHHEKGDDGSGTMPKIPSKAQPLICLKPMALFRTG